VSGFRAALSLLTRVPAGGARWEGEELRRAVPWFPIVGALLGAAVAGVYAALRSALPPPVASVVAVGAGVALTGALHEDGLADTADALVVRDRDEAVRILDDPRHGTYGVLAIVLSVVLRVAALAALGPWEALAILPMAHALSRAAAGALLLAQPARPGLGASYAAWATPGGVALGAAAGLLLAGAAGGWWALPAAAVAGAAALAVGALAGRRFGGVTGDVLGAAQQVGEAGVLALGAAAAAGGWGSPAWWR
jgi:adenosylcobinamide-GDP ribazoletransferase